MRYLASAFLLFFLHDVQAEEKIDFSCNAAEFSLVGEFVSGSGSQHVPNLPDGQIYYIGPTLAPFVNASNSMDQTKLRCEKSGKPSTERCVFSAIGGDACRANEAQFRIRAMSKENERFVVKDRCGGNYLKFVADHSEPIEKSGGEYRFTLIEEQELYQFNNQIIAGTRQVDFPTLSLHFFEASPSIDLIIKGTQKVDRCYKCRRTYVLSTQCKRFQ